MKRRSFIKSIAPVVALPAILKPFSVNALSSGGMLNAFLGNPPNDNILVMIFLNGGNDGLNTLVPLDQYSKLAGARPKLLLPESSLHKLSPKPVGLHPSLNHFKTLYNEGKMQIIQSIGYPKPNFSHFRSTDIWNSGSDAEDYVNSGWIGRFLEQNFEGYPFGYPNANMPDPLAIQIGTNMPLLFQGNEVQTAFNINSPEIFNVNYTPVLDPAPDTPAGSELTYIRQIGSQIKNYAQSIIASYVQGNNAYTGYPGSGSNYLADLLKLIARLISGGLKTRIYLVSLYGFDTHASQAEDGNPTLGTHASLLKMLNDAVFSFQRDIEQLGVADKTLGMTFSEFGRRIISNASLGTDHGAAAPMFLFGTKVQPGILGTNPNLPTQSTENDNLPMQYDFRSVYASILSQWFCLPPSATHQIMLDGFQELPLIQDNCSSTSIAELNRENALSMEIYPNPMVEYTRVRVSITGGMTRLELFDPLGRSVYSKDLGKLSAGSYIWEIHNDHYAKGNYYVRVQCGSYQQVSLLQVL
jgi:uncharacterized protein (DUF1501 family)